MNVQPKWVTCDRTLLALNSVYFKCSMYVVYYRVSYCITAFQSKCGQGLAGVYCPSTAKAHNMAVKTLASFCIFYGENFPLVSICTIWSFIEFLSDNALATIRNYLRSVNSVFKRLSINVTMRVIW
jgi:hypothetical protein